MKVAFASSDGKTVDEHFGAACDFHVWEVGPDGAAFVGKASALAVAQDEEDRISARANALAGCAIVYTLQIGGPAAAKLVARRIHPIKTAAPVPIQELLGRLRDVLNGNPPPWLRKAMNARTA